MNFLYSVIVWLICDCLPFYAHVDTCNPSYTDEEQKANVDSETVCLVLLRLWVLSIELYFLVHVFFTRTSKFYRKIAKVRFEQQSKGFSNAFAMRYHHSIISESSQFCLQTGKSLKFHRFESARNFKSFSDLKFLLFSLFLIFMLRMALILIYI